MGLGSPLQRIAMGMVVVVAYAWFPVHPSPAWERYDALADPLGWVLVVLGTLALVRVDEIWSTSRWLAVLAGVVSVPMWFPQVHHLLDDSGLWFASLPQAAYCLWLSRTLAAEASRQEPRDTYVAKRFGLLVWGFAVVAVLPVLTLGGGLVRLAATTELVSLVVNVAFVYYLFRVHRREWLGGPGPLLIHPRTAPGTHEGRPPSS